MKFSRAGKCWVMFLLVLLLNTLVAEAADFDKVVDFEPIRVSGIEPVGVDTGKLTPGLSVVYFLKFFERHLDLLPEEGSSRYGSFQGEPILELNHQFGKDKVFDSGSNRGVGMRMSGLLYFKETGVYDFQALSNDGISMFIANVLTLNDPEQHSDRLSNIAHVSVDKSGWYPVMIGYFQRKGTATIKLFWKTPGSSSLVPVPAEVYAHLP